MPEAGAGMAMAAAVAVDVWSQVVGMGGVAFKTTARAGDETAPSSNNNIA